MKYCDCKYYYCNYPFYRCTNEKSPHYWENPYDIEPYDKSTRVRCPFQGAWSGKGENPCKFADWKKKPYPVFKYQGHLLSSYEIENFLLRTIKEYGIMHLYGFYRMHLDDMEWEAQLEELNKPSYKQYGRYYSHWKLYSVDLTIKKGTLEFKQVDKLRFFIQHFGTYHIFEFLHSIIPKKQWKQIKNALNEDNFPEFLKEYRTIHTCHSCDHEYIKEFISQQVPQCPSCGWDGY